MSAPRVYIKPFNSDGTYAADWIEVSDDVVRDSLGRITFDLDNTDFDIGVYRFSNSSIRLFNKTGKYSDVENIESIFRYTRANSLVKITWSLLDQPTRAGVLLPDSGEYLSPEQEVFQGFLSDESLTMSLVDQTLTFKILGRESIFQSVIVPFGSIHNGDLLSQVLYACLNQPEITDILTVDPANISLGIDQTIDSIASLQNQTVQEGLDKLLLAANSVLTIQGGAIYIQPRTPTTDVRFNFYGQGSVLGADNIISIQNIKNGLAKTFNFLTWKGTTLAQKDSSSVTRYGARKFELNFEFMTDATKQANILSSILSEFSKPKQEFEIACRIDYPVLDVNLLDRISVDYPLVSIDPGTELPLWGAAVAGVTKTPIALYSFTLSPDDHYKVISKTVDLKAGQVILRLRAIADVTADALPTKVNGTGIFRDFGNLLKKVLSGDFVPRASTGKPTDVAGGLGVLAQKWVSLFALSINFATTTSRIKIAPPVSPTPLAADYDLTAPAALAASKQVLTVDSSGVLRIEQIGRTQFGSINYALSSSCGTFANVSGLNDVPNLSVTITTVGRPVMLLLISDGSGNPSGKSRNVTNNVVHVYFVRTSTTISQVQEEATGASTPNIYQADASMFIDVPPAGTYTYKVQTDTSGGLFNYYRLLAVEL